MSDLSRHTTDITSHPDVAEMRERYARPVSGRQAAALDGIVLLTGMYAAISPWVVHFHATRPELTVNNLVIGLVLTAIGLGLTRAPERMYQLTWTCAVIGGWLVISPWVVTAGHRASAGPIGNNVLIGAVTSALGLAATRLAMGAGRRQKPDAWSPAGRRRALREEATMTLPMRDRRVLAEIEQGFLAEDPDLALLLGTFGDALRRRRRPALALRRRAVAVLACTAVAVSVVLLTVGCLAQSTAALCAAGAMAIACGAPWVMARRRTGRGGWRVGSASRRQDVPPA
ncbi:hypothetical protein GCM10010211_43770 [Streptomyces albospinus]|uniref:SPW repeat-containing integral membrane domain-containing protein n=1 Tax=Streptomyces albospinus TaxID=285515 RepID=A0ABQ2VBK2_9ACTN|nr:SPW repeat protein [Streptomyces albospinus]GGU73159.1 hypothetical protein GCM10010211_43770 [Streptomyces albospinus]